MNRTDRLFGIALQLQSASVVRARDLAAAFEVSERTIYRDMQALSELGVPIVATPGEGYSLAEGYYLPPLIFTTDEAAALFLSAQLLSSQATGKLQHDVSEATKKITAILPDRTRAHTERLTEIIRFYAGDRKLDLSDPTLEMLQQAITARRPVFLRYHSYSGDVTTERVLEPTTLTYSTAWYVTGYCRLRCAFRDFRLDRIEDLKLLDETFEPRSNTSVNPDKQCIRVAFREDVARWVRERQHYGFSEEKLSENRRVVMTYNVERFQEITPWLLSWGAAAEVLEPLELRNMLRSEAEALATLLT